MFGETDPALISHEHRVIFVHIPKAAGTSVEAALGHLGDGGVTWGAQDHRSLRQVQWPAGARGALRSRDNGREAAKAIKARLRPSGYAANRSSVTRAQYAAYFKFSIVRNPWARAYSWYRNVVADPFQQARLGVTGEIGFDAFLRKWAGRDLLRPQLWWLTDFSGDVGVDLVCRFENLDHDYAEVRRRAALPAVALPHLNRRGNGEYRDAYDGRSRRLVAERYRAEIERFGYTFDSESRHAVGTE